MSKVLVLYYSSWAISRQWRKPSPWELEVGAQVDIKRVPELVAAIDFRPRQRSANRTDRRSMGRSVGR